MELVEDTGDATGLEAAPGRGVRGVPTEEDDEEREMGEPSDEGVGEMRSEADGAPLSLALEIAEDASEVDEAELRAGAGATDRAPSDSEVAKAVPTDV